MAKHIHVHLVKDANVMTLSLSKVLQKCKNGEWEGMQDVVPNRTLQFKNCTTGRTFFVNVTYDASSSEVEACKEALKALEEEHEKKRDQGVTVTPADIKKLVDLRNELKKLTA